MGVEREEKSKRKNACSKKEKKRALRSLSPLFFSFPSPSVRVDLIDLLAGGGKSGEEREKEEETEYRRNRSSLALRRVFFLFEIARPSIKLRCSLLAAPEAASRPSSTPSLQRRRRQAPGPPSCFGPSPYSPCSGREKRETVEAQEEQEEEEARRQTPTTKPLPPSPLRTTLSASPRRKTSPRSPPSSAPAATTSGGPSPSGTSWRALLRFCSWPR